jgi:hypothetical protein
MTANAWQVFDIFYDSLGAELHNLDGVDAIKMGLILSGWTPNLETDVTYSVIAGSYEHAAGNGYTAGGDVVAATWDAATSTLTFDVANNVWTAGAVSILARHALLYNTASGGTNDLIAHCLMNNSPADVEATAGNTLTVTINGSGVFTIAQA